jgi:hypothetical protein
MSGAGDGLTDATSNVKLLVVDCAACVAVAVCPFAAPAIIIAPATIAPTIQPRIFSPCFKRTLVLLKGTASAVP